MRNRILINENLSHKTTLMEPFFTKFAFMTIFFPQIAVFTISTCVVSFEQKGQKRVVTHFWVTIFPVKYYFEELELVHSPNI